VVVDLLATRGNFEKWNFQSREKPSAGEAVWKIYEEKGADAALAGWAELQKAHPAEYNFAASEAGLGGNRPYQRGQTPAGPALLLQARPGGGSQATGRIPLPDRPGRALPRAPRCRRGGLPQGARARQGQRRGHRDAAPDRAVPDGQFALARREPVGEAREIRE